MSNFVEDINKVVEEGKSAVEVVKKVLEDRKFTDMSFSGKNKFNLNTLSNLFLIDGCIADLQNDIKLKRAAGTRDGSNKISMINARVNDQVRKLNTPSRIGYELSAIINRDGCPELEEKLYAAVAQDEQDENMLKTLHNFNKLSVLDDYLVSRDLSAPAKYTSPIQQFLVRSLTYFNDRIEGVYKKDKNTNKKEEFHPLVPVVATVILARNMQASFADKKLNSIGDSIENFLESYMYALMERDRVGKKNVDTDKVVLDAENLVNELLSTHLKRTKNSGEYLHDINLYGKLMETTNNADQLSSGIDKNSTSPLAYVSSEGFIEKVFREADNVQFVPAQQGENINKLRYFASGDINKVYSALKCIQGKIAGVEVDPQTGIMNSMFVNPDKNFEFAVYGILYTHYSGLYMKNPDLAKALVEGFADVYGETIGLKSEEEVKAVVKNAKQSLMEDLFELGDFGDISIKEGIQFLDLMSLNVDNEEVQEGVLINTAKVNPLVGKSLADLIHHMEYIRRPWIFIDNSQTPPNREFAEADKPVEETPSAQPINNVQESQIDGESQLEGEKRVIKDSETVVEKKTSVAKPKKDSDQILKGQGKLLRQRTWYNAKMRAVNLDMKKESENGVDLTPEQLGKLRDLKREIDQVELSYQAYWTNAVIAGKPVKTKQGFKAYSLNGITQQFLAGVANLNTELTSRKQIEVLASKTAGDLIDKVLEINQTPPESGNKDGEAQ